MQMVVDQAGDDGAALEIGLRGTAVGEFADGFVGADGDDAFTTDGDRLRSGKLFINGENFSVVENAIG